MIMRPEKLSLIYCAREIASRIPGSSFTEDAPGFKTKADDYLKYAPAASEYLLNGWV